MTSRGRVLLVMSMAVVAGSVRLAPSVAAQVQRPTGLEVGILPAINFDSDEGFGYGAIAELYHYGAGTSAPYVWTLQPTVFLTTEGRRDFTAFFDAPHLLPAGWRLGAFLGSEKHIATPYYGIGNATSYDEALDREDGANPFYYRFGRNRYTASVTLQRRIGDPRVRFLLGGGVERTVIEPVPEASGTTLYAQEVSAGQERYWSNSVRAGLIWDTSSGAPSHELFRVSSSLKSQEGLGGAKTVRGVPKNRFVGRGLLVWNAELRWRVADFELLGKPFHAVLSAFIDQGRVWEGGVRLDEVLSDLHRGFGGGLRVGMGENFVVAIDGATSSETGVPIYIGLGYLF